MHCQKLSLTELNLLSVRGARRRQPSQSSLRYQQKKALNVLIRPVYRHDRIVKCGISGVAMMGGRTSAPLFVWRRKTTSKTGTGLAEAGVTVFYTTEIGSITASISSFSYAAVTGILLQSCPLLATAQHRRAMRLAMATIATFLGFFAKMFFTQSVRYFDLATS